jgi:hypothetical protein
MLIKTLSYREEPLASVLDKALSGGCEGVVLLPHNASNDS